MSRGPGRKPEPIRDQPLQTALRNAIQWQFAPTALRDEETFGPILRLPVVQQVLTRESAQDIGYAARMVIDRILGRKEDPFHVELVALVPRDREELRRIIDAYLREPSTDTAAERRKKALPNLSDKGRQGKEVDLAGQLRDLLEEYDTEVARVFADEPARAVKPAVPTPRRTSDDGPERATAVRSSPRATRYLRLKPILSAALALALIVAAIVVATGWPFGGGSAPKANACAAKTGGVPTNITFRGQKNVISSPLTAALGVANIMCGDTQYSPVRNGLVDDVIKAELFYGNEDPATPTVQHLQAQFSNTTATQAQPPGVRVLLGAGGQSGALFAPIPLSLANAKLKFIPGSVTSRINVARSGERPHWVTRRVSDAFAVRPSNLPSVGLGPQHYGTLTALYRIVGYADSLVVAANPQTRRGIWHPTINIYPGQQLQLRVVATNEGNLKLHEVTMRISLPADLTYIAGSTEVHTGGGAPRALDEMAGMSGADSTRPGFAVGSLDVGQRVELRVVVGVSALMSPGATEGVKGTVSAAGIAGETYNYSDLKVVAPR